jgi:hypothetical protein
MENREWGQHGGSLKINANGYHVARQTNTGSRDRMT